MTFGVMVKTVADDSWRVVTTQQAVIICHEVSPLLWPATDLVYWTEVEGGGSLVSPATHVPLTMHEKGPSIYSPFSRILKILVQVQVYVFI